jgi:hypothetical protein
LNRPASCVLDGRGFSGQSISLLLICPLSLILA